MEIIALVAQIQALHQAANSAATTVNASFIVIVRITGVSDPRGGGGE